MTLRVLVVDDVASMRRLYMAYFEHSGLDVDVVEAASGEEAIRILDQEPVDVVLTDHRMGAVTGIDVLVHALQHQPNALRCMMTGYADPDLSADAYGRAKAHLFMEKGMDVQEITGRLERELASKLRLEQQDSRH